VIYWFYSGIYFFIFFYNDTGNTTEKLQKTAKNEILISNTLFNTIETNKNNDFSYFVVVYNIINSTYGL